MGWARCSSAPQDFTAFHASPVGGHSGFPVTYKRIISLFRWQGVQTFIKTQVQSCLVCQQAKPERVQYPGLLSPLPVPSKAWDTVSMDFISGLPTSFQYNCILVVIDKFSKYGHLIPLSHPFNAQKVAEAFLDNVYKLHGMPRIIIWDRDPVFTSAFWKEVCNRTRIQLRISSGQHPQTDGQTERVNQQVEGYLRCFITAHPQRWFSWLPLCELWYNTNWHSSTGRTPFELVYGHPPCYFGLSPVDAISISDAHQWLRDRHVIMESVKQHLIRTQQRI